MDSSLRCPSVKASLPSWTPFFRESRTYSDPSGLTSATSMRMALDPMSIAATRVLLETVIDLASLLVNPHPNDAKTSLGNAALLGCSPPCRGPGTEVRLH